MPEMRVSGGGLGCFQGIPTQNQGFSFSEDDAGCRIQDTGSGQEKRSATEDIRNS